MKKTITSALMETLFAVMVPAPAFSARRGISALMPAARYGSPDVCTAPVKNDADVQGRTCDYAFVGRPPEIISMIREKTSQKPTPAKKKP